MSGKSKTGESALDHLQRTVKFVGVVLGTCAVIRLIHAHFPGHDFGQLFAYLASLYHARIHPVLDVLFSPLAVFGIRLSDAQKDVATIYLLLGAAIGRTIFRDQYVPGSEVASRGWTASVVLSVVSALLWPLVMLAILLLRYEKLRPEFPTYNPVQHSTEMLAVFGKELAYILCGVTLALLVSEAGKLA